MTAPSRQAKRSSWPPSLDELIPKARKLANRLGTVPSRNQLMKELHIGAPKAKQVLAEMNRLRVVPAGAAGSEPFEPPDGPAESDESSAPDESPDEPDTTEPGTAGRGGAEPDDVGPVESAQPDPVDSTDTVPPQPAPGAEPSPEAEPEPTVSSQAPGRRRVPVWPVLPLTMPAFAAVWSGWVSLGGMAGFGVVHPLPGIADHVTLNTAITLPIGVEMYAAYALWVWLSGGIPKRARRFAKISAIASLITGALGQVTYHLLSAAHYTHAPWPVTMLVACLPVAVLGMGAALAHLVRTD